MSENGPRTAQELMSSIQRVCYAHEGTLNKFLIDDKGMLFLVVFGLPPLVHPDDPSRAVLASFEFAQVFKRLALVGRFGVTTGRSYCGVCGSAKRMEYTVLGDCVNLSARLMSKANPLGILCDEETSKHSTGEFIFHAMPAIKVKGKTNLIPIFAPMLKQNLVPIGLTLERKVHFPWYDNPTDGAAVCAVEDAPLAAKNRLIQLCSVGKWSGITKVQDMLGGPFNKAIHSTDLTISSGAPRSKAPGGSPFADGGVVVISGKTGLGKIELAEHIITHCSTQFQMLPIFGTMGPRPGESSRMAIELLRSSLCVFRHLSASVPGDDVQALVQVVPPELAGNVPVLGELLNGRAGGNNAEVFETAIKVVIALLTMLKKQTPVLVVLQFEVGTSLFPNTTREDQTTFWSMTAQLAKLVRNEKHVAGLVLCNELDESNMAVKSAVESDSLLNLRGLEDDSILEYMSNYLGVPENAVPPELRKFIGEVTLGNPLYIRETLDQLRQESHMKVKKGASATLSGPLDQINIAQWNHTQMIGGTVCLLESLDPIEAAALKMSTCFEGPFTLPDLAASSCSQWGGASYFDLLRLYGATRKLMKMNIIELVHADGSHVEANENRMASQASAETSNVEDHPAPVDSTPYFQMQNLLVRTVGASMVLEAQKKSVKRNALIDRVLKQDLPERMLALSAKKSVQHIPWYYERALRRML